jgi:hypothetical protein
MGSHFNYCDRYPTKFQHYNLALKKNEFGKLADLFNTKGLDIYINCYDNSILYSDFIIDKIIKTIRSKNNVSGLIYFSDHADDVTRWIGHDSTLFTYEMVQIPFIFWFSKKYQEKYTAKFNTLIKNQNALFPNDLLYDTLIGIMDIKTFYANPKYDLSHNIYESSIDEYFTLHCQKNYKAGEKYIFHQKNNINRLISFNLSSRVIPHRVNTIGKLKNIQFDGFNAFEVDLFFEPLDEKNLFEIGHDNESMSGINLLDYLKFVNIPSLQKIWLDIKNIDKEDMLAAKQQLHFLSDQFQLKDKIILESDTKSANFSILSAAGFHISYYLPTNKILTLISDNDKKKRFNQVKKIADHLKKQNVVAISFDASLYSFVKQDLERLLNNKIVYHLWNLSLNLWDVHFIPNLFQKQYYSDERVKTILVPYLTRYNI